MAEQKEVYLPSYGAQVYEGGDGVFQTSPLLSAYSPRLFGSPPQLSALNDIRLLSSPDGEREGAVGDFYLTKILQNAQIAYFTVGKALFTGGMSSIANMVRVCGQYAKAVKTYDIFEKGGLNRRQQGSDAAARAELEVAERAYNTTISTMNDKYTTTKNEDGDTVLEITDEAKGFVTSILEDTEALFDMPDDDADSSSSGVVAGGIMASVLTSLSVQQPFYTFERDWYSYINNVKMMINTAVIMLGLNDAVVRIGDELLPIGLDGKVKKDTDVWSNYRFITATTELGTVTGIDKQNGDTSQYVSFMVEPAGSSESYTNSVGESQIYSSVINQGSSIGAEIAFITNSSVSGLDDAVINIAGGAVNAAEKVLSALGGAGRFTAAIAGSMVKSFMGDHTIYPQIFQSHTSTSSKDFTIHLVAQSGDPYTYLTDVLVPLFFILGMALPQLSKNNASAYTYPPLVQVNVPGLWGTRLGMVTSVSVNKNPTGKDFSVHGYPLSIDVTMSVADLQHTLVTSPMNNPALFLNNHTMFDYIAQCAGVDRFRINPAIRLVSRLALAANAANNILQNIGNAALNDVTTYANIMLGTYRFE
jgi:hypothetical protein